MCSVILCCSREAMRKSITCPNCVQSIQWHFQHFCCHTNLNDDHQWSKLNGWLELHTINTVAIFSVCQNVNVQVEMLIFLFIQKFLSLDTFLDKSFSWSKILTFKWIDYPLLTWSGNSFYSNQWNAFKPSLFLDARLENTYIDHGKRNFKCQIRVSKEDKKWNSMKCQTLFSVNRLKYF